MSDGFDIQLIQADHGDAILINYGKDPVRHLLVDGGPASSIINLMEVLSAARNGNTLTLEAIVITHYDFDHIGGIIALLEKKPDWLIIKDIWFNGYSHLKPKDGLGPGHSDALSSLIVKSQLPQNRAFEGKAVCAPSLDGIALAGGLLIWIMSPTQKELTALGRLSATAFQENEKRSHRDQLGRQDSWPPPVHGSFLSKPFIADKSASNASSIAMLLSLAEKKILLLGDACEDVICATLENYWPGRKLEIDFLKMSHHGSQANISKKLLNKIKCKRFGFSTNGKIHAHPDQLAVARVIASTYNPELIFNYANSWTNRWRNRPISWPLYSTTYPVASAPYVRIIV
jgi:beta-lactamase superfamily II metal-dependent hydrolase